MHCLVSDTIDLRKRLQYFFGFQGTYKTSCLSNNMMRCEVGDLSGKHARLNVGFGKQFFTDPDLPLFGEMSGKIILSKKETKIRSFISTTADERLS